MTESSQDKTKRKLINHIKTLKPTHQTAIFFNNFDEAIEFNDLMQKIKKPVSAAFEQITMIWILRLKYQQRYGTVGYIQILTNAELDLELLNNVLDRYTVEKQIRTVQREFDYNNYIDTVNKQKLTNLSNYLGSQRSPRRFAITNRPKPNKGAEN